MVSHQPVRIAATQATESAARVSCFCKGRDTPAIYTPFRNRVPITVTIGIISAGRNSQFLSIFEEATRASSVDIL